MSKTNTPMAYAAIYPGTKGYGSITADMPEFAKDIAKDVARWIRAGATVEHVSVVAAQAGMLKYIADKRLQKKRNHANKR